MEKLGIAELKDVLAFGLDLGSALWLAKQDDGKIDFKDLPKFISCLVLLPKALIDVSKVPEEIKDLDENEMLEIKDLVIGKISNLPNAGLVWLQYANAAIKIAIGVMELLNLSKKEESVEGV